MYKEFNGREWSSEEAYLKFQQISRKNFKSSLALENYADFTGDDRQEIKEMFKLVGEYYKLKNELTEQEMVDFGNKMADKYEIIFDLIGRENFKFYEDGDVNYIWPKQQKKEK